MLRPLWRFTERVLAPLPGWMFLISGMAIVGLALLVPTWMEWRELKWRLDLMRLQTQRIVEQHDRFKQFNEALASDDPILLERLAFYHLSLKREGLTPLQVGTVAAPAKPLISRTSNPAPDARPGRRTPTTRGDQPDIIPALANRTIAPPTPAIEDLLERQLPVPGVDYPAYTPVQSRLVRITTGQLRLPLIAAGLLAILAGLYMPTPAPRNVFEEASDDDRGNDDGDQEAREPVGSVAEQTTGQTAESAQGEASPPGIPGAPGAASATAVAIAASSDSVIEGELDDDAETAIAMTDAELQASQAAEPQSQAETVVSAPAAAVSTTPRAASMLDGPVVVTIDPAAMADVDADDEERPAAPADAQSAEADGEPPFDPVVDPASRRNA